jgi:Flp pilus assembly pilin Flp
MRHRVARFWSDCRGAVSVEYLILAVFVAVPTAIALLALIPRIQQHYANERAVLAAPYP